MSIKGIVDGIAKAVGATPAVDRSQRTMTDGSPVTDDHREIGPNGMQRGYVVLSEAERARGFVRPIRRTYVHVGHPGPVYALRDLTPEEHQRYDEYGYLKYEEYPRGSTICGRFWTQAMLDSMKGCGVATTMGQALAETYARDPKFYSGTFCVGCGKHFPVGASGEFIWEDGFQTRVGT